MWELDHKETALRNWCFWTAMLEETHESPLHCKEIKPVNPKGNQSWIFFGRTDAEAEAPVLWPDDGKNLLIGKDPDAGKDWRQEEKGMTEDEMVGWHHRLNGHEFEQAPEVGDGQESLVCSSSWGCKESDTTKRLDWTDWFSSEAYLQGCCECWQSSSPTSYISHWLLLCNRLHVYISTASHSQGKKDTTTIRDRGLPWWLSC